MGVEAATEELEAGASTTGAELDDEGEAANTAASWAGATACVVAGA